MGHSVRGNGGDAVRVAASDQRPSRQIQRHCEPSGFAFGKPKDRLREAIQEDWEKSFTQSSWIASSLCSSQ
ncbi:hypothetical protein BOSEA31B_14511 [Hyphomicrobiales bacterium]|nr:hypothetical protein BOSEA31B_14511 [Hyphomicrobiales bacterium]CAH1700286.1 hypothetical protein BOSEA1005_13339 [Hyphomicrobiales bacterium]CAI0344064.1 hypothetical protein BO1005MUT1_310093 [Hyphomicrobiales bacterium]